MVTSPSLRNLLNPLDDTGGQPNRNALPSGSDNDFMLPLPVSSDSPPNDPNGPDTLDRYRTFGKTELGPNGSPDDLNNVATITPQPATPALDECQCQYCGRSFPKKELNAHLGKASWTCKMHVNKVTYYDSSDGMVVCCLCEKRFLDSSTCHNHLREYHNIIGGRGCRVMATPVFENFLDHLFRRHLLGRNYSVKKLQESGCYIPE
ncbi:hypothetical protein B0T24DRAFT_331589 [Lasiosphaeria ovina]|uniref:C2H2-type domain-containing protein n=1 Tax=Lasiosphaeria ovina TaxID=92902 RepID=A0AAE0N5N7_9PEZI|nr:hypothetical protein B0T24DRAFT_331589 [Lasiosphaeria ovina]